jgi:hypothetical protein
MKIWVLLSVDNNYDQPDNNLVAWWECKPSILELGNAMEIKVDFRKGNAILGKIYKGEEVRFEETDFRLRNILEGELPNRN